MAKALVAKQTLNSTELAVEAKRLQGIGMLATAAGWYLHAALKAGTRLEAYGYRKEADECQREFDRRHALLGNPVQA